MNEGKSQKVVRKKTKEDERTGDAEKVSILISTLILRGPGITAGQGSMVFNRLCVVGTYPYLDWVGHVNNRRSIK